MVKGKEDMVSRFCRTDMLKHVAQLNAQVVLGLNTKTAVEPVPVKNINFSWFDSIQEDLIIEGQIHSSLLEFFFRYWDIGKEAIPKATIEIRIFDEAFLQTDAVSQASGPYRRADHQFLVYAVLLYR